MNLQKQAEEIVNNYKIEKTLSSFGEVHLVGNVALKTTIKPDIDFQIYAVSSDFFILAEKIEEKLHELGFTSIKSHKLAQSNKYLVKSELLVNDDIWTIDISLTEPSNDYLKDAYKFYLDFHEKLNPENRKTIEFLKIHFLNEGKLKNSMAYYIYRSVIDEDAKTPDDVLNYKERMEK